MTTALEKPRRRTGISKDRKFSKWHEDCIENLLSQSGLNVRREPLMAGKTPDLLVTGSNGQEFVVECIARLPDPGHIDELESTGRHVCHGDIACLRANLYSRLDQKATKYREIAAQMPYIIALYDGSCMNSLATAIDMTMSPYRPTMEHGDDGRLKGKKYNTLWSGQEIPGALFDLYPHLSGLLYSRWPREHHYLPNPNAAKPVSPKLIPFASVPALPERYRPHSWQPKPAAMTDHYQGPPEEWERQLRSTSDAALHQLYAA